MCQAHSSSVPSRHSQQARRCEETMPFITLCFTLHVSISCSLQWCKCVHEKKGPCLIILKTGLFVDICHIFHSLFQQQLVGRQRWGRVFLPPFPCQWHIQVTDWAVCCLFLSDWGRHYHLIYFHLGLTHIFKTLLYWLQTDIDSIYWLHFLEYYLIHNALYSLAAPHNESKELWSHAMRQGKLTNDTSVLGPHALEDVHKYWKLVSGNCYDVCVGKSLINHELQESFVNCSDSQGVWEDNAN